MQLSVIIVNYKAAKFITGCLESALVFPSAENFEWIVVDNDSKDGSKEILMGRFPFIRWIDMNYNAGFARANNAGIKAAATDVVLLLNPDTIVVDDCLQKCLDRFLQDDAIACSVQLNNPDGSPQITGNFFMKGGLNQLLPLPYLGRFLRSIAFTFNTKRTNVPQASQRQQVGWINGAFLMVKKAAINKAGFMDEDFFLYAEEAEWCSRLNKAGALVVYGNLNIIHLQGEVINESANTTGKGYFDVYGKKGLQLIVSNNLRIRKQYGARWYLFNVLVYVTEIPVFFICTIVDNLLHLRNPLRDWKRISDFTRNVFVLLSLSLRIISSKKYFYKMM